METKKCISPDNRKNFIITILAVLLIFIIPYHLDAQQFKVSPVYEPDNPTQLSHPDMDRWSYIPSGLLGSVGSTDIRYERDIVPMFSSKTSWNGTAWRGEKINIQLVLWSNTALQHVRVDPSSLFNENNKIIDKENIHTNFVRYVLADNAFYACGRNTQKKPPILVADIIDNIPTIDMPEKSTRPVWLTISVPPDADPGTYEGEILVKANNGVKLSFKINLKVLPLLVPAPADWSFTLDLWQNPWSVARFHDVKPWSDEHILLLKPLLKMLADAGQKYITTTIIYHPWNAQTFDPYDTMVEWIKNKDGSWSFDYSIFDKYVDLCMECGINKYISCYSMICFRNNNFRYYDEAAGDYKFVHAEPGTEEYEQHWRPFLTDFSKHLADKGWLGKTFIAMDERPYELMKEILGFIKSVNPEFKINLASEDWQEKLHLQVHSYSASLGRYTRPEIIKQRREKGLVSTFYPCCVEPKPNTYPHSNPAESAWMGWLAAADGFSGFLRWAYNSWVENPLYDTRYIQWNAGECFVVYPGARSSIRFKRLREGFQDYEKIGIVKQKLKTMKGKEAENLLLELERNLDSYSYHNAQNVSCAKSVNESKDLLNRISNYISGHN
ncbi:DUF4091 domain-containing protein [candidate division KSB1 bacterium]|nr:DUF4091 domain-containing protein [candidate division KSB1 bacterium]